MKTKILSILFLIATIGAIAQDTTTSYTHPIPYVPQTYNLQQVQAFPCAELLAEQLQEYELYEFDFNELYQFANSNNYVTEFKLQFKEKSYLITLQRNDLRSPNYKSAIGHIENESEIVYERTVLSDTNYIVKTFKGFVNGKTDNIARFTIDENYFTGYVHDSETKEWIFFDSYQHFTKDTCDDEDALVVYDLHDIIESGSCQTLIAGIDESTSSQTKGMTDKCTAKYIEIATEADFDLFQKNGINTNNEILSNLNLAEGIYSLNFNIMFSVVYQRVWEVANDPYDTDWGDNKLANEVKPTLDVDFQNIDRDVALLFTGINTMRDIDGDYVVDGNAWGLAICRTPALAYGIITDGGREFSIIAHEIGHGLGIGVHPNELIPSKPCALMCSSYSGLLFFEDYSFDVISQYIENWGGCLNNIDPNNSQYNDWVKTWSNDRNRRWIGTWYLNNGDKKVVGDFDDDDDEEILFMSKGGWCNMIDYSCNQGSDWHHMWSNFGNNTIHTWNMHKNDKYFAGDFDGDGISELLSISYNSSWASLQEFNSSSNNWSFKWSNYGNGKIEGWVINKSTDKFVIDDFTNDGKDDLLCISASGWAGLFSFNGSNFQTVWHNGGNNYLEGNSTPANSAYTYLSGDFNNNGTTDLLAFTGTWVTMIDFNTSAGIWSWKWSQWGANNFASMYILPLNSTQKMFAGNFDMDNKEEVLNINNTWSATADWNSNTFQQNWNNGGTNMLSDWQLNTGYKNKYLTVKATPHNNKHVLGIKYMQHCAFFGTVCNEYPGISNMYRSNEFTNKSLAINLASYDGDDIDNGNIEKKLFEILLYPNPTNDLIKIELDSSLSKKEITLTLFDIQGKQISIKNIKGTKSEIDLSNLQSGFYTIQISDKQSVIANHKIVVQ